jgi:hypothetical protein
VPSRASQQRANGALVYSLMLKLHAETDCGAGRDGTHGAECDAIAGAFGYASWTQWRELGLYDFEV